MVRRDGRDQYEKDDQEEEEEEREYALEDSLRLSSSNTWLSRFRKDWRSQETGVVFYQHFWSKIIIPSENRKYQIWVYFILLWAIYSSVFTPIEFGFFRGLPTLLWWINQITQIVFIVDIILTFFVAFKDRHTYKWVVDHRTIGLRYAKTDLILDVLGCLPWEVIYKKTGEKEFVRYFLWVRLYRARKVESFFRTRERDIRFNYLFTRIVKLIAVELYCTHTAACIFYFLATTLPPAQEELTWIGSLRLGGYDFSNFREIDLGRRYVVSLYFAIITMATVGYGDIHAVNTREMVFVMVFVSFDMVLGAYLIGNMTALIVKGSNTEKFRDKMTALIKYMNRNRLERDVRSQLKNHLRLQYECQFVEDGIVQELPFSIRAKVSRSMYFSTIQRVLLFQHCSLEFINQIARRVHEEYFLPGEEIIEQGNAADQIYFVAHGSLIEVATNLDGCEEIVSNLEAESIFGEVSALCGIPQPYTIRVSELCKVLRIDKDHFFNLMEIYFTDGRRVLNNLLKFKSESRSQHQGTDIAFLIAEREVELSLKVNNAAYLGKTSHLKSLIKSGANPNWVDYHGRSPLHLAAGQGHDDIVNFLVQEGADVNAEDKFGNTPLIEAIKGCHTRVVKILRNAGAIITEPNVGEHLRNGVWNGHLDFVTSLLQNGANPNSADRSGRTALHIAISQGMVSMAKKLIDHGANVNVRDRWGRTPIQESRGFDKDLLKDLLERPNMRGNLTNGRLLSSGCNEISTLINGSNDIDRGHDAVEVDYVKKNPIQAINLKETTNVEEAHRRCTVFACFPWVSMEERKCGVMLRVPDNVDELLRIASKHFSCTYNHVVNDDMGEILDTKLIRDLERVYVIE